MPGLQTMPPCRGSWQEWLLFGQEKFLSPLCKIHPQALLRISPPASTYTSLKNKSFVPLPPALPVSRCPNWPSSGGSAMVLPEPLTFLLLSPPQTATPFVTLGWSLTRTSEVTSAEGKRMGGRVRGRKAGDVLGEGLTTTCSSPHFGVRCGLWGRTRRK